MDAVTLGASKAYTDNAVKGLASGFKSAKSNSDGSITITFVDDSSVTTNPIKGQDGYTPKKGVDYWTTADQNEIKQYVDAEVNAQVGGVLDGSY